MGFKEIAKAVKFTSNLFGKALSKRIKATILYATETGKSEQLAKRLGHIFSHAFNVNVSAAAAAGKGETVGERMCESESEGKEGEPC